MPLVSICVPAYNAEKYISETLSSVCNQKFADWELIVVEDGSKDNTEKLVKEIADNVQQPVHFHRHENNMGLPATRNSGIKQAAGKYVALLDADDYWKANHLESMVSLFEKYNADIIHSGSILFDSDTGKELSIRAPKPEQENEFLNSLYNHSYIIQPSSALIKRNVFERIEYFDTDFRICDDMEFWFRAARNDCRFIYSGQQTCYYRKHGRALSSKSADLVEEIAQVYKKHLGWSAFSLSLQIKTTSRAFANAGRMHFRANPTRSSSCYFKAWKINPVHLQFLALALLGKVKATFS